MKCQVLALAIAIVVIGAADPPRSVAQSDSQRAQRPAGVSGPPFLPDLVIHKFELLGHPEVKGDHIEVSVAIGIKNQGRGHVGHFKVGIEYTYANPAASRDTTEPRGPRPELLFGPYYLRFSVGGSSPTWGPMAPGQPGYRKGEIIFPPTVRGVTVLIRAIADPCSGGLDIVINGVQHCNVIESNETNNTSAQVSVSLP